MSWLALGALSLSIALADTPTAPEAPRPVAGMVLPQAPAVAPGAVPPAIHDPLRLANERHNEGDAAGVVAALTPWLESRSAPWGRTRTAGHLLLATAHKDLGNWNLASRHFYKVRRTDGPLAPYGAWNEADVDHNRGRHLVAVKECRQYREKWPDGPHADECLLLMGDAYAAAGHRGSAIAAYGDYLERHPDTPRKEEIRLGVALAWARTNPERGIQLLHELALSHSYPSTDLAVQAELGSLAAQGHGTALPMPYDPSSRMRRCASLRRSGRYAEAWAMFQQLASDSADLPAVAGWVEKNEENYAWGTRRYDVYATAMEARYAERPDPGVAWQIFRAWSRDGEWSKAAAWGRKGMSDHKSDWRWRGAKDDMAWATLLAAENEEAAERWSALAKRGGDFGRKARFYSALSHHLAGDQEAAIADLDTLLKSPREWKATAHYWRAKARAAIGDEDGAATDRTAAAEHDKTGWYDELLRGTVAMTPDDPSWRIRDGRWHGATPTELGAINRPETRAMAQTGLWPASVPLTTPTDGPPRAALLDPTADRAPMSVRWSDHETPAAAAEAPETAPSVPVSGVDLPNGYVACEFWDPAQAEKDFFRFANARADIWPGLPAAYDLASAGLYTDAARLLYEIYEEWRDVQLNGAGDDPRRVQIAELGLRVPNWRPFLLFVRDHYHAARACSGLDKYVDDPGDADFARRLAYPVVRPREIWAYGQRFDVDPFLVMAIMRQESTYRNTALSPVGAIGLVQVMPRTGAKVAALLGEQRYSPRDLEDPQVNLRYGVYYLGQLLDRFDGAFPMAVGSYNGGPHNMSRWYKPRRNDVPMDVFVELIQYDETRDYVKKVTGHYARYVRTYEGPDARVRIPLGPTGDDKRVIDF